MDLKKPLRIGDAIFVRGKSALDRGIEWAENGVYSHVAFYAGDNQVLEAQGNRKVGYAPLSEYANEYDIGHVKNVTYDQQQQALGFAVKHIGARYAWRAIFVIAVKLLLHFDIPYKQTLKEFICSFYYADAWNAAGKVLTNIKNPTPQDLANSPEIEMEILVH